MSITTQTVKDLIKQKDDVEEEIKGLIKTLESTPVGVKGSLVDIDGFPRNDLDVNAIREMRHVLACKQNDHITLMKQIERDMAALHADLKEKKEKERAQRGDVTPKKEIEPKIEVQLEPFVHVNSVAPDSPADRAGMQQGDEIVQFGTITKDQVKQFGLQIISDLVSHNINSPVMIKGLRRGQTIALQLIPQTWTGRGYLG
jgi:26S proteasome non-ATPase regulatory subunit 9